MSTFETRAVLAGAYDGGARSKHHEDKAWRTHTVELNTDGSDMRASPTRARLPPKRSEPVRAASSARRRTPVGAIPTSGDGLAVATSVRTLGPMKIIVPGREQKGWSTEAICTGNGNGDGGCQAKLLVEQDDLFTTASGHHDGSTDTYVTFKCAGCGVLTDLPDNKVPSAVVSTLPTHRAWEDHRARVARAE